MNLLQNKDQPDPAESGVVTAKDWCIWGTSVANMNTVAPIVCELPTWA